MRKKRGISISSTVLQFDYNGFRINLLDTPGHKDFSEDTYRVLTAVDAVIMVIDAGKGIESQTRKLFEVCRQRQVPIFTFINKLDRPTKDPLSLIDELEKVLNLHPYPMNWPLGTGGEFKGLYDRRKKQVHLFERVVGGAYKAPVGIHGITDPLVKEQLHADTFKNVVEEIDVLEHVGANLDPDSILRGETTPVFFGSAMNNFGVQLLLDGFLEFSAPPLPRRATDRMVEPHDSFFSAFIFKIQGNMDPKHRDRLAFMRICSGKFERDMAVHHSGTGKKVKLTYSHRLFGQERESIDEAYAGDVVGLVGHQEFKVGDTLSENPTVRYNEIPRFPPECFANLHNQNISKSKAFRKGLDQLLLEGIVQPFSLTYSSNVAPLLAAVGPLQFEVLQYRLETEYGVETRLDWAPWTLVRWVEPEVAEKLSAGATLPSGAALGQDGAGNPVVFFSEEWGFNYFSKQNPDIRFFDIGPNANG